MPPMGVSPIDLIQEEKIVQGFSRVRRVCQFHHPTIKWKGQDSNLQGFSPTEFWFEVSLYYTILYLISKNIREKTHKSLYWNATVTP